MTNYLFFLIIFLIPVGLAQAETGKNFDTIQNPDGTITWTSHHERILDGGQWVDYIPTNNLNDITVETAYGSVKLDKTTCEFSLFTPGIIGGKQPILTDSIKAQRATFGTENWSGVLQVNNAVCQTSISGSTLTATKSHAVGLMEYKYIFTGTAWKTQLEATNLSALIDQKFGFNQTFNLNTDTINYGGSQKNLDNFDGQSFNRAFLENNQAKIIDLLNGQKFDFDLGFDNLESVSITDTGLDKSSLNFTYTHNANILLPNQKLIIDPTFTSNNPSEDASLRDADNDNNCEAVPGSLGFSSTTIQIGRFATADGEDCGRAYAEYDVTSIPDASIIVDVDFNYEITAISGTPANCDFVGMATQPTIETDATNWAAIGSGATLLSNNAACATAGTNKGADLGSGGNSYIQTQLGVNWAAIGIKANGDVGATDATYHTSQLCAEESACTPDPTLTIIYSAFTTNAVTDLTATDIRGTAVDLDWSTPSSTGTITGYQINYTTPWGSSVNTIVTGANDTESIATAYTVTSLAGETPYSFRVGVWTDIINASGNVLNITTDFDPTASFTPGTFNLTGTGTDVRDIKYIRDDIDDTSLFLNITADNDFELACNFHYKFANINQTYTNIANTSINANEDMASFRFNNVTNEIIDVLCWDQYTNSSARYLITITDFPLLQQIADFKAGEFGTLGMFGALDFISLLVVIFATVGFNRVNETVGIVFGLFIIGGLAVLSNGEIISWATTFTAGFAVVIMWAIATTRKD